MVLRACYPRESERAVGLIVVSKRRGWVVQCLVIPQAAQAQDVNKLFNTDTVTQRTIYRDCMGN